MIKFAALFFLVFSFCSCERTVTTSQQNSGVNHSLPSVQNDRPFEFKKATITYELILEQSKGMKFTETHHIFDFGRKAFSVSTTVIPGKPTRHNYEYYTNKISYEVYPEEKIYRVASKGVISIQNHGYFDVYGELDVGEEAPRGIIRHPNETLVGLSCHVYETNKPILAHEKIWIWKGLEMKLESEYQTGFTVKSLELTASIPEEFASFPEGFTLVE